MEASSNLDWSKIKLFVMDVDGILTNAGLYVSSTGADYRRIARLTDWIEA